MLQSPFAKAISLFKGTVVKKIDFFKELTPCLRTYELRGQGKV